MSLMVGLKAKVISRCATNHPEVGDLVEVRGYGERGVCVLGPEGLVYMPASCLEPAETLEQGFARLRDRVWELEARISEAKFVLEGKPR